jgi:hypothetical protein
MTAIHYLVLVFALAVLMATAVLQSQAGSTLADPFYCVVVRDGQGNPIDTVCVPGPSAPAVVASRAAA